MASAATYPAKVVSEEDRKRFDAYVRHIAKTYDTCEDTIRAGMSPEFDTHQMGSHGKDQVQVSLCGTHSVWLDPKIASLLVKINSYFDEPVTWCSCQHDGRGYVSITFSNEGFAAWIGLISDSIKLRYSHTRTRNVPREFIMPDEARREPLFKRFDREHDFFAHIPHDYIPISFSCSWCYGAPEMEVSVVWRFNQSDIPTIMKEMEDLLDNPQRLQALP